MALGEGAATGHLSRRLIQLGKWVELLEVGNSAESKLKFWKSEYT